MMTMQEIQPAVFSSNDTNPQFDKYLSAQTNNNERYAEPNSKLIAEPLVVSGESKQTPMRAEQ